MKLDGDVSIGQVLEYLAYSNYAHNRRISPDLGPARLQKFFGPVVWEWEEQFQAEQATIAEERS